MSSKSYLSTDQTGKRISGHRNQLYSPQQRQKKDSCKTVNNVNRYNKWWSSAQRNSGFTVQLISMLTRSHHSQISGFGFRLVVGPTLDIMMCCPSTHPTRIGVYVHTSDYSFKSRARHFRKICRCRMHEGRQKGKKTFD